ncbi:MAG: prepilin peptidase [Clostridia bacterium]|nr:prepilin peptidase [Clostridia bacterium]
MKTKSITNSSNILLLVLGLICLLIRRVSCKIILNNVICALVIYIIGLIIRFVSRKQIGGGDIKMLVALSVRFNLIEMIKIIIISIFLGAIYASYLLIFKKKDKNYRFAFGEFIALGAILLII